jgi:ABC-type Fe3+ transport system permease subunit
MKNLNIYLYSFLCVLGFVIPNYIIIQTVIKYGTYDFSRLFSDINYSLYTSLIGADLAIAATTFLVFYIVETRKTKIKKAWLSLLGCVFVGLSFGFPLFLLIREVNISKRDAKIKAI